MATIEVYYELKTERESGLYHHRPFVGEFCHLEAEEFINQNIDKFEDCYPTVYGKIVRPGEWFMEVCNQRRKRQSVD